MIKNINLQRSVFSNSNSDSEVKYELISNLSFILG